MWLASRSRPADASHMSVNTSSRAGGGGESRRPARAALAPSVTAAVRTNAEEDMGSFRSGLCRRARSAGTVGDFAQFQPRIEPAFDGRVAWHAQRVEEGCQVLRQHLAALEELVEFE